MHVILKTPLFLLLAVALAGPAMGQWSVSGTNNEVITSPQARIVFGKSGEGAQIHSSTDAVNMTIRNRTSGGLTIYYGTGLVLREGTGGGTVTALLKSDGSLGLGTSSPAERLDVRGTTQTEVLKITGGSDVAELFEITGAAEPGTVVAIDPQGIGGLRVADAAYDRTVVGIVSGAGGVSAGMLLGQAGTLAYGSHPVAVSGRVYVKADTSNGPIVPDDLLTTSARPGHVMKATDGARMVGAIVGKALTPLADDSGLVLAVVALQ